MKTDKTYIEAYDAILRMPRISNFNEHSKYEGDVFLLPENIDFDVYKDSQIKTYGLGKRDKKVRDLVRILDRVDDALNLKYTYTNVLTPLMYAEDQKDILWHITTQGILYTRVTDNIISWISKTNSLSQYGMHDMDRLWLPCNQPLETLKDGDVIGIFNRRVAGWDGSHDRPVIELLGAGGHLPTIYDSINNRFGELSVVENMNKEASEELGTSISSESLTVFGGYINSVTHELVILVGVEVECNLLPIMQEYAFKNLDEDTKGIYLGRITDVMNDYREHPEPYAGGAKTALTNFPNQDKLMEKVFKYLEKKNAI